MILLDIDLELRCKGANRIDNSTIHIYLVDPACIVITSSSENFNELVTWLQNKGYIK